MHEANIIPFANCKLESQATVSAPEELSPPTVVTIAGTTMVTRGPNLTALNDASTDCNVMEAAKVLGKSIRQVQRLLQRGDLKGQKVHGLKGPEWRVNLKDSQLDGQISTRELTMLKRIDRIEQMLGQMSSDLKVLTSKTRQLEERNFEPINFDPESVRIQSDLKFLDLATLVTETDEVAESAKPDDNTSCNHMQSEASKDEQAVTEESKIVQRSQAKVPWWQRAFK